MMQLENLTANFQGVQIKYTDIVNYEIARENICGYIFLLSRISKNAEPTEKMPMESKIEDLIYYRDNLQICVGNTLTFDKPKESKSLCYPYITSL
ncbi:hypothetical protein, partial [Acinetobacter sp. 251-1]|uniref:hypothetical protein n=1 Tax=Acinetobacter sp. 251-1 TaxID=2746720 RepID=UPI002577B2F1